MNVAWLVLMTLSALVVSASPSVAAYDSTKVCGLLTPQELMAAGIAITAQGLMPDESLFLKKGELPGLITDVQIDECTSEMAVEYVALPSAGRWVRPKIQLTRKPGTRWPTHSVKTRKTARIMWHNTSPLRELIAKDSPGRKRQANERMP